jgi:DNA-binding transcriptional ArsR family regulator
MDDGADMDKSLDIEAALKGRSLTVYMYLLRAGNPVGVREIQRGLNMSSPSVASHHLEKLKGLGLVDKDAHGRYYLTKTVEVGVLKVFTRVGRFMLPRYSFYAAFFTTLLILYIALAHRALDVFALTFVAVGCAIFWYETVRIWRRRPV